MRYLSFIVLVSSCATCPPAEPCPETEVIYLDCEAQITEHKIKTVTLLGECREALRACEAEEEEQ